MSLEKKIANAREVDIFSELSQEEKMQADLLASIAIQIHTRRIELDMTQAEFARFNNVTQAMVSKWESGEYNFSVQTLAKVFCRIGLTLDIKFRERIHAPFVVTEVVRNRQQKGTWQIESTESNGWGNRVIQPQMSYSAITAIK